ncbi:uncharacterized protein LOC141588359 [Silene latifolia]|uniref:uncharacterized protein LOC141588359 n=1 Tax=Silene latifolia TaxID=37657 RepID=UPI003D78AED3
MRSITPETELIKHNAQKIPIWMKLFGLDVKYWGKESLKKLSGVVGKFIKCDDATFHKNFLGFAWVMIEVDVEQQFPTELQFVDEHGKIQTLKRSSVQQSGVRSAEVLMVAQKSPAPVIALTPVLVQQTPVVGSSMPRRFMAKFMRTETGEKRRFTDGGLSFMESLTHYLQTSRLGISTGAIERGEGSKSGAEYGLHRGGRIWLIWDPNSFEVEICDVTVQSIHASVVDKTRKNKFWFTVVYGLNHAADREVLWSSLRHYHSVICGPWLVDGDFNAVLARNERIGGASITNAELRPLL